MGVLLGDGGDGRMSAERLADSARRLMDRETPWLAVSPPRYAEPPICLGCGVKSEPHPTAPGLIFFLHDPTCAAVDLVDALADFEEEKKR